MLCLQAPTDCAGGGGLLGTSGRGERTRRIRKQLGQRAGEGLKLGGAPGRGYRALGGGVTAGRGVGAGLQGGKGRGYGREGVGAGLQDGKGRGYERRQRSAQGRRGRRGPPSAQNPAQSPTQSGARRRLACTPRVVAGRRGHRGARGLQPSLTPPIGATTGAGHCCAGSILLLLVLYFKFQRLRSPASPGVPCSPLASATCCLPFSRPRWLSRPTEGRRDGA